MKYLSQSEVKEALSKALDNNLKHYTILNTLLLSGIRASECSEIRPSDIDFKNNLIGIIGKGNRYRDVFITNDLTTILKYWIKINNIKSHERLWTNKRESIWAICRKYTGKGAHAMRHTYAITVLRRTKNIEFLRQQLGHRSLRNTQVYLKFMDFDEERKRMKKLFEGEIDDE